MAETMQQTPRSPLVGEHDCAFRAVGEGSAANTRSGEAASEKDSPLTLPAMRLARISDALSLRYLSAARKIAAESPLPQGERGKL
jgi:hypothetical protein